MKQLGSMDLVELMEAAATQQAEAGDAAETREVVRASVGRAFQNQQLTPSQAEFADKIGGVVAGSSPRFPGFRIPFSHRKPDVR